MGNIEQIYSKYDTKTVEANKRLPKPCYGNSIGYYCNYECSKNEGCYAVTMQKWGVCNCKFRPNCHIPRQMIQENLKEENSNHECDFKKYFDENSYSEIVIPDGIIRMKPIID